MSTGSTPLAVTMETVTCSWSGSTCTTMRLLVSAGWSHQGHLALQAEAMNCASNMQVASGCLLHFHFNAHHNQRVFQLLTTLAPCPV